MMTVYDLIKHLTEYPPDMPVLAPNRSNFVGEPSQFEVAEFYFDEDGNLRETFGYPPVEGYHAFNALILYTVKVEGSNG